MKKLFILAALVLFSLSASAQKLGGFNVKAGIGVSSVTLNQGSSDSRFSWNVGLGYEFLLGEKFGIEPSLLFNMLGAGTQKNSYLQLPVMASVHASNRFAIDLGPYIGILVGANNGMKSAFKSFDAGAKLGFKVFVGENSAIGLHGIYSFPNIYKSSIAEFSNLKAHNWAIQASYQYNF